MPPRRCWISSSIASIKGRLQLGMFPILWSFSPGTLTCCVWAGRLLGYSTLPRRVSIFPRRRCRCCNSVSSTTNWTVYLLLQGASSSGDEGLSPWSGAPTFEGVTPVLPGGLNGCILSSYYCTELVNLVFWGAIQLWCLGLPSLGAEQPVIWHQ